MNEEKSSTHASCCNEEGFPDCSQMIQCMKNMFTESTKDEPTPDFAEIVKKFWKKNEGSRQEASSGKTEK